MSHWTLFFIHFHRLWFIPIQMWDVCVSHVYLYMRVTEPSQTSFGPLIKEECPNSLKTMASDKTPEIDDLPAEFIKFSGEKLKVIYLMQ